MIKNVTVWFFLPPWNKEGYLIFCSNGGAVRINGWNKELHKHDGYYISKESRQMYGTFLGKL